MQKSSSKNVSENDVKIVNIYVKMEAEIVKKVGQKSFKKSLRKFISQNVEKNAPNVTPRGAQGQPCPGAPWARSAGKR